MYKAFEQPAIVKQLLSLKKSKTKWLNFPNDAFFMAVYPESNILGYSMSSRSGHIAITWTARKYYVSVTAYHNTFTVKRK